MDPAAGHLSQAADLAAGRSSGAAEDIALAAATTVALGTAQGGAFGVAGGGHMAWALAGNRPRSASFGSAGNGTP